MFGDLWYIADLLIFYIFKLLLLLLFLYCQFLCWYLLNVRVLDKLIIIIILLAVSIRVLGEHQCFFFLLIMMIDNVIYWWTIIIHKLLFLLMIERNLVALRAANQPHRHIMNLSRLLLWWCRPCLIDLLVCSGFCGRWTPWIISEILLRYLFLVKKVIIHKLLHTTRLHRVINIVKHLGL